ncbi:MAG TPA: hypothetical protein VHP30_14130, partial [Ignavibacteriales bacterium]|nr:hypothetical protein [Ignavibacteriales bacterium]
MKKKLVLLIICCSALLSFSCHNDANSFSDPTYFGEGFHGITFTSEMGGYDPIGPVDPSDWCNVSLRSIYKGTDDSTGVEEEPVVAPASFSFGPAY